jgi:DNA polymerase III epsilon subunit family exonuclease
MSALLSHASRGAIFHIVDLETTGLSSETDRIIELATVTVRDGEIIDRFETLVNPGVAILAVTTNITGIDAEALEGAPTTETALKRWLTYLGEGGQFVAHNADFDWRFLKAEFARAGLPFPFKRKYCTMKMAETVFTHGRRIKLEHLVKRLGVDATPCHRAMADAEAAAKSFIRLLEHLRDGTTPASLHAKPAPPVELTGNHWEDLVAVIRPNSHILASILTQYGRLAPTEAPEVVRIELAAQPLAFVQNQQDLRGQLDAAVKRVFGDSKTLQLAEA